MAVLVIGAIVVIAISPAGHTDSTQSAAPASVTPATAVPAGFTPAWSAQSAATTVPALGQSVIVTADGGEVIGHDPATGEALWHYSRQQQLCTAAVAWPSSVDEVLAVYRNSRGCSEVTALNAATGARKGARTSDADSSLRLITDSGYVLAQGPTRLETWGSNLVRGIEYGRISAPVNPGVQPDRTDCQISSAGISGERVALIERCAGDPGYRLTVLGALLDGDEKVTQHASTIVTGNTDGPPPVLITMSSSAIAVYDGGTNSAVPTSPAIRQYDIDGKLLATSRVNGDAAPPADSVALSSDGLLTFFTGTDTVILDAQSLKPKYQVPNTLGPGEVMAGRLLLPSPAGITSRNPATGEDARTITLDRTTEPQTTEPQTTQEPQTSQDAQPTVSLRVLGDQVIEQRGSQIEVFSPS